MKTRLIAVLFAMSAVMTLQSCIENPPGEWQRPPRYGHGGTESTNKRTTSPQSSRQPRNRFGYSGDDTDTPPTETGSSNPGSRDRDLKPIASGDDDPDGNEKPAVEKPSGPPPAGEMPFAKGVPGKPLSVKVPGRESLGEISIEQFDASGKATGKPLPPGTPVSIPDPQNPGKEIYFKVP